MHIIYPFFFLWCWGSNSGPHPCYTKIEYTHTFFFLAALGLELWTSQLLGRHSTTWTTSSVLFYIEFFQGSPELFALGWHLTMILLKSASWVARIIGMSHQHLATIPFCHPRYSSWRWFPISARIVTSFFGVSTQQTIAPYRQMGMHVASRVLLLCNKQCHNKYSHV
jgi:hypothetical protein